ncbi:leucine-tRNA ligase [Kwoniella dejecticola CBS 10117]|uniref:leucine--tRNA ligase n=1 Tax=Kwoniella dejecticola CBS 10117 TaxID=1296121 RepID=A0A1A6AHJ9_9TREE|nr:leucine-tRNA ligase [Kwoniella dejecticola CBS 10117]OBR89547.1 leucine-tRNA ligase [Kwoniella dejecticola CBS 10117]
MAATVNHDAKAGSVVVMEKTDKRDYLIALESDAQKSWSASQAFETNPPPLPEGIKSYADFFSSGQSMEELQKKYPKWFGTFPYAYMNGSLHLGHAFTISKIEFAAGFERMRGKKVLFPVGYHATGMPIKAASDKLIREMEMFGEDFSGYSEEVEDDATPAPPVPTTTALPAKSLESTDPSKGKKGKLNAKSTGLTYQFQILELIGVPRDELKKFADPYYWLTYFPPIAKEDLSGLGARVDWRRQFLTTDANPYYDSFVRWQMNKLYQQGKVKFGKRYTIYSPKDGQPCMDHDRQSGEAVNPQEYTAVKMEVLEWGPEVSSEIKQAVGGKKVWMVAATLRPETMYGQTNCFVGPNLKYGLFESAHNELFLVTERAARNMAFQGTFEGESGRVAKVADVVGSELLGTKVAPPFGVAKEVYVLPMEGVLATKGTGVVTSVPSDSPDDYRTLMDLRKKAEMYKIKPEWAAIDPIPVLKTPKYGDMAAEFLCNELKIQSQRDKDKLAEAKDLTYKEGFYNGVMVIGDFKGETVQDAKPKVRQQMMDAGLATPYAEPESEVISRSADVCVVALVDQWYLDYGEDSWKASAFKLLEQMNTYQTETRNGFEAVLNWLNKWACARSYGLGSKLPWDPVWLVESLSDSTIYMSYYTIANLLHDDMFGKNPGPLGIKPEQMTDEVWEYVLGSGALPADSPVEAEKAAQLKYHFSYFYPLDIRSSGKDLIPNHLTFWIYIHAALFPEKHWPRAVRTNGHLMLNGKKMSKSTGNFLTMKEATKKYGADAARLTLADAGDDITDANFEETVANAAILRLHTACLWAEEMKSIESTLRTGEFNEFDKGFQAEMNALIEQTYSYFDQMEFKSALKSGLYDFENARNWYRLISDPANGGQGMHRDMVFSWIRNNTLLITPFTPHYSQHIWKNVLGETSSIQDAQFPKVSQPVDKAILEQSDYMKQVVDSLRSAEATLGKKKGKGKSTTTYDSNKPKQTRIYVAQKFPEWQEKAIAIVKESYDGKEVDDAKLKKLFTESGLIKDKKVMPFAQQIKRKVQMDGSAAFERTLPFDELHTLKILIPYIQASAKFTKVDVVSVAEAREILANEPGKENYDPVKIENSQPGVPEVQFWNE